MDPANADGSSYPLAAQIPLQSFTLPTFPPTASRLRELTITSDIPLPSYQALVTTGEQYELPVLPPSITHITLELFSLGFPGRNPHFLTNLAKALPNLTSITFFSSLIDGLTEHSRDDAQEFFSPTLTPKLQEVHVIDSFVRPGFWTAITKSRSSSGPSTLRIIEVSYTYRGHEDAEFLARLHGEELPLLLHAGIIGAAFNLTEVRPEEIPDVDSAEAQIEDAEGNKMLDSKRKEVAAGILPFASDSRATNALRKAFKGATLGEVKVLNLSLWTLTVGDLGEILRNLTHAASAPDTSSTTTTFPDSGLIDLTVSLLLTPSWLSSLTSLFTSLSSSTSPSNSSNSSSPLSSLSSLEIIGVPSHPTTPKTHTTSTTPENDDWRTNPGLPDESQRDDLKKIGAAAPGLRKVEMSILKARRAGTVVWRREEGAGKEGEWTLGRE